MRSNVTSARRSESASSGSVLGTSASSRPTISRSAYQLTKSLGAEENHSALHRMGDSFHTLHPFSALNTAAPHTSRGAAVSSDGLAALDETSSRLSLAQREKQLEDEVMGTTGGRGQEKSRGLEKNLEQMVKVLNARLKGLENAAKTRMRLCEEDLNASSSKTSKDAPKIVDDFDEIIPKSIREMKRSELNAFASSANNNNNNMTGNNNASLLPGNSGNNNSNTNTNVNTGNSVTSNAAAYSIGHVKDNLVSSDTVYIDPFHLVVKTKAPTETAKKLEAHLEEMHGASNLRDMKNKKKPLSQNDRSKATEQRKNEAKKAIRQKIEKKLQTTMENFVTRSVMDPELVFNTPETVNVEAIWPVPVKWCARDPRSAYPENVEGEFDPDLLLRYGMERMSLPSGRKLFVWLIRQPMIQRYFVALFWLLKVKFFEGEDIAKQEAYLMRLISIEYRTLVELLGNRAHAEHEKDFIFKYLPFIFTNAAYFGFYYVFPGSRHIYTKSFKKTIYMQVIQIMHGFQMCAISVKVIWGKIFPEDIHDDNDAEGEDVELFPVQLALKKPPPAPVGKRVKLRTLSPALNASMSHTLSQSLSTTLPSKKSGMLSMGDHNEDEGEDDDSSLGSAHKNNDNRSHVSHESGKSLSSFFPGATKEGYIRSQDTLRPQDMLQDPLIHNPLAKTYLKPALEKPSNVFGKIKRQNQIERLNAKQVSPQMAFFLSSMRSSTSDQTLGAQMIRRTVPVSWCPAGGSDTHHRVQIQTSLHDDIGQKLKQSQQEFGEETRKFHETKLDSTNEIKDSLQKVLSSGPTNVSRFSLDIIRRQRMLRGKEGTAAVPTESLKPEEVLDIEALNQLAAREIDIEEVLNF